CRGPGKSVRRLRLHVESRTRGAERVSERLHRSSAGGCLWRLQRSGGRQRHHPCRMLVARAAEVRGGGKNGAGDRPRGRGFDRPGVCDGKTGQGYVCSRKTGIAADAVGAGADGTATEVVGLERTTAAEAS